VPSTDYAFRVLFSFPPRPRSLEPSFFFEVCPVDGRDPSPTTAIVAVPRPLSSSLKERFGFRPIVFLHNRSVLFCSSTLRGAPLGLFEYPCVQRALSSRGFRRGASRSRLFFTTTRLLVLGSSLLSLEWTCRFSVRHVMEHLF